MGRPTGAACSPVALQPERPLVVGGRAVRADELAVCDLAGSSDEEGGGPKWGIKKKQAIAL
jgi:hypothetical protein